MYKNMIILINRSYQKQKIENEQFSSGKFLQIDHFIR
jgi:hypothetical protein